MTSKQVINVISVAGGLLAGLAVFLWLSGSGPYNLPSSVVRHEAAPNDGGLESFTLKL
jgi:hypothetical protein